MVPDKRPKKFILNNPRQPAHNKERKAFYRERAAAALADENISATDDMLDGLEYAAWRFEGGAMPSILPMVQLFHIELWNRVNKDAIRISSALNDLEVAWNSSVTSTQMEIEEEIESNGMSIEDVAKTINVLSEIVDKMASEPRLKKIQGNQQQLRAAWILWIWQNMKSTGNSMNMRAASRVIAKVLDGDDNKHAEGIYQTIRNSETR